jgi:hypothetical protein
MSITGPIRIATLAAASLMGGATFASAQLGNCPAPPPSPSYSPDFTANQNCLVFNETGGTFPLFVTEQPSNATLLRLTPAVGGLATSAWYRTPQVVANGFSTTFAFQIGSTSSGVNADGIAFVIQNSGLSALGPGGCGIGFGDSSSGCASATGGISNSVAIEFNTFPNGSPVDPNGNDVAIQSCPSGAQNSVDYQLGCNLKFNELTSTNINLSDGTVHVATVTYAPTGLSTCGTGGTQPCYAIDVILDGTDLFPGGVPFDITSIGLTSSRAFVGFTAGTGGDNDDQDILSWTFTPAAQSQSGTVTSGQTTPTTFNINGGFVEGSPTTGYAFTAGNVTASPSQNLQMVVTAIPISQTACNALVNASHLFPTAECFVYQNGGGQGQDTSVLFEVTCPPTGSCGSTGNPFDAELGTNFSFNCSENIPLQCGLPPLPFSFGFPNLTSSNGLPSIGFLKGEGPDAIHPCTPYTNGTALFASNQIDTFILGDTSGGAKGGSGGTTSCWVMTYETQNETPAISIIQPANGATYAPGQSALANYSCSAVSAPAGSPTGPYLTIPAGNCTATDTPGGNVANGSQFDTSTLGLHTFTVQVLDSATNTNQQSVTYSVVAAPVISGPSSAIFIDGNAASVTFSATGYPVPTFTESGALPAGVTFTDNKKGIATLSGTATTNGVFSITITASNGVGSAATLSFTLTAAATAPAAGKCNGIYIGTFKGNLAVSSGQTCTFIGGGVTGNITENGGTLVLTGAAIGGNIQVNGGSFSVGSGVTIKGSLSVVEPSKSTVQNQVCGATIGANLQVLASATPVAIGSNPVSNPACAGNIITGNLNVSGNNAAIAMYNNTVGGSLLDLANAKPTQVFSNRVRGILICQADSGITGGSNSASLKLGQCSQF